MRTVLQLEALAALAGAIAAYHAVHGIWLWFAVLFIAPDLSFAGYTVNSRVGAVAYNLAHTYVSPAVLLAFGLALQRSLIPAEADQVAIVKVVEVSQG